MFSGIVEWTTKVLAREGGKFTISNMFWDTIVLWQSIAHDGACMTITAIASDRSSYDFFMMEESLQKTHFADKYAWYVCNVERSLQFGQRVDGHLVSGHIDTVSQIFSFDINADGSWDLRVELPADYIAYCLPKWSIALNGTSLTIVDVQDNRVKVCLIPYTYEHTNFGFRSVGDRVNIECDSMAKYVVNTVKLLQY